MPDAGRQRVHTLILPHPCGIKMLRLECAASQFHDYEKQLTQKEGAERITEKPS